MSASGRNFVFRNSKGRVVDKSFGIAWEKLDENSLLSVGRT